MSYNIVPLSTENIKDLTYLYKHVFGNNMSIDMVKKKFDTDHLGVSYFGHLAYENKKPVAFHGAIPVLMKYNGLTELAAQYGDAMTMPGHTGKGLFTKLGKYTDQQLKKAGIKFVWGFPNQNSEYGYLNKLDWKYKERMLGYTIKTSFFPFGKVVSKFDFTKNIYDKRVRDIFSDYITKNKISGSVFKDFNCVSTSRDQSYYDYKSHTGNFTIDIDGVLFWIKIKNDLLVGDIEASDEALFYQALKKLKSLAYKSGIMTITFQASPNTQIAKLLHSQAEAFSSWIVGFKNFSSSFPLEELKLTFGDLDTF